MLSPELAEELIARSRPRGRLGNNPLLLTFALAVLMGVLLGRPGLLGTDNVYAWILVQVLLLASLGSMWAFSAWQRRLRRTLEEAVASVQLRDFPAAREGLLRILAHPIRHGAARAQALLALATVAERDDRFDTSQVIYESLLTEPGADPFQRHSARVHLAEAMLRNDQLTDAVSLIDRLERETLPDELRAGVKLVSLLRAITMGQVEVVVQNADPLRELFRRHLSTKAGYGYALLAAAFDRCGAADRAARFWRDATLLLPTGELLQRYEELESIAQRYSATERIV